MSPRTLGLSEVVSQYLMQVGLREPDVLRSVRQDTARLRERICRSRPSRDSSWPFSPV